MEIQSIRSFVSAWSGLIWNYTIMKKWPHILCTLIKGTEQFVHLNESVVQDLKLKVSIVLLTFEPLEADDGVISLPVFYVFHSSLGWWLNTIMCTCNIKKVPLLGDLWLRNDDRDTIQELRVFIRDNDRGFLYSTCCFSWLPLSMYSPMTSIGIKEAC